MSRLLLLLPLLVFGSHSALGAQAAPEAGAVLQEGDSLYIAIWRKPELSGGFQVGAGGAILHPLYRSVTVAGIPLPEVEQRVHRFLRDYDPDPRFVLQPRVRVSVGGYVQSPSLYFVDPGVTIAQAVGLAGGALEIGRKDRVLLVRDGRQHTLNLLSADPGVLRMTVRSGDQLIVERKPDVLRDYLVPAWTGMSALGSVIGFLRVVGVL